MFSHGAIWNFVPLSIRELMLGDHLAPCGLSAALIGKTHYEPDRAAMGRLGIEPTSPVGQRLSAGGFEVVDHYEGHANPGSEHPYVRHLKRRGYVDTPDPWGDYVMSSIDEDGELASGWQMRHAHLPARVREEDSETAYTTDLALKFIRERDDKPWCLHLSYIKPHWPYLAPSPYHDMYGPKDCTPVVKNVDELRDQHPVLAAYRKHPESVSFARDEVVRRVKPTYMGLVKQLDDHLGRLFAALTELGRMDDTLIVFTSDHGDYLGDHWLGDKELFHQPSVRIPFIVYDPDSAADKTRGCQDERLVESVDFLPTVLDALDIPLPNHLLEGRSLLPVIRGAAVNGWRDVAVSEIDYSFREARLTLQQDPRRCRGTMLFDGRWKCILWDGFRPQLYDLQENPDETIDFHDHAGAGAVIQRFRDLHLGWLQARKTTVTLPDDSMVISERDILPRYGIEIGSW